jgi:hypothetical protein
MRSSAALVFISAILVMSTGTVTFASDTQPAIPATRPAAPRPVVWMGPPGYDNGKCFRELFEHPDQWKETRSLIDVLCYTDLNFNKQFSDDELKAWFAMMRDWRTKLGLEVGSIKPWSTTGEKTFNIEKPMWERIQRLGGDIQAIAMDEPLCCCRKEINKDDDYAVRETANYIALVRKNYPQMLIGDIEPYPFIPLQDQETWIDALEKRLAEMNVRGLDFFRLDVNWIEFTVYDRGSWPQVRKLEQYCRRRKLPFSLIYWGSGYPGLEKRKLADDSTWYTELMQQGYDYAMVDGRPDQIVLQSWLTDAPTRSVPEADDYTFTRSVRDFCRRFVKEREPATPH